MKITSADKIQLIKYGFKQEKIEADASIKQSNDIKKVQDILKSFTKLDGKLTDLVGAIYYEIMLEQDDRNGGIKKETYSLWQITKVDYAIIESDGKRIYIYRDEDMELDGLFEKYLNVKSFS